MATPGVDRFVAISAAMVEALAEVERYVRASTPLVLVGGQGTGREALAGLVHAASGREGLLLSRAPAQLGPDVERRVTFGEERPAVQGLLGHRRGWLEQAAEGTLLLLDFERLHPATQQLTLDAVYRRLFRPVDVERDLPVRCRLILTLREMPDVLVERGVLAAEVRVQLGYAVVRLPTLDERREDIPALAHVFLEQCAVETGVPGPTRFARGAVGLLAAAHWRGNLWQLRMVIREAYLRAQRTSVLGVEHLSRLVEFPMRFERRGDPAANARAVRLALHLTDGRVRKAARLLCTAPSTIRRYQS